MSTSTRTQPCTLSALPTSLPFKPPILHSYFLHLKILHRPAAATCPRLPPQDVLVPPCFVRPLPTKQQTRPTPISQSFQYFPRVICQSRCLKLCSTSTNTQASYESIPQPPTHLSSRRTLILNTPGPPLLAPRAISGIQSQWRLPSKSPPPTSAVRPKITSETAITTRSGHADSLRPRESNARITLVHLMPALNVV